MKKWIALLLALTLATSLMACGGGGDKDSASSAEPSVTEPVTPPTSPVPPSAEEGSTEDATDGEDSTQEPSTAPDNGGSTTVTPPTTGSSSGSSSSSSGAGATGSGSSAKPTPKPTPKPESPAPKPETPAPKPETPAAPAEKTLSELMDSIMAGVDAPKYLTSEVTAEAFPGFLFIDQPTGATAVSADAMIGSIAHSVVLMRLPADADVAGIAQQVKDNANPNKWICVGAEKTEVKTKGNLVLLVMSAADTVDAITANFDGLSV